MKTRNHFFNSTELFRRVPYTVNDNTKLFGPARKESILVTMTVTILCGCHIIGNCMLWADFGNQLYWLWVTPDARVGWAMSSERDRTDECATRGLFVFLAREMCQDSQPSKSIRIPPSSRLHVHQSRLDIWTLPFQENDPLSSLGLCLLSRVLKT